VRVQVNPLFWCGMKHRVCCTASVMLRATADRGSGTSWTDSRWRCSFTPRTNASLASSVFSNSDATRACACMLYARRCMPHGACSQQHVALMVWRVLYACNAVLVGNESTAPTTRHVTTRHDTTRKHARARNARSERVRSYRRFGFLIVQECLASVVVVLTEHVQAAIDLPAVPYGMGPRTAWFAQRHGVPRGTVSRTAWYSARRLIDDAPMRIRLHWSEHQRTHPPRQIGAVGPPSRLPRAGAHGVHLARTALSMWSASGS
jgi:hypothetical protein